MSLPAASCAHDGQPALQVVETYLHDKLALHMHGKLQPWFTDGIVQLMGLSAAVPVVLTCWWWHFATPSIM